MAFPGGRFRSITSAASQTHLPPSPELSATIGAAAPPTFSLFDSSAAASNADIELRGDPYEPTVSRLRSAANYSRFEPQVVACSPPHVFLSSDSGEGSSSNTTGNSCSLGAIAGGGGIAVFRTSRPDEPLLLLSHSVGKTGAGIKNLAFEPSMDSMYLAASRGNGLLVWDASGHSISPLLGRLTVEDSALYDDAESINQNNEILSLSWKAKQPAIIVATPGSSCLWDLRCSLGMKGSKPALRFNSQSTFPLVNVACSYTKEEECASMDSRGVVRVHDLRMTNSGSTRRHSNILASFNSCRHAGVGLSAFRTNTNESHWMTWGLDAPKADAVVGIWSSSSKSTTTGSANGDASDDYWRMDGSEEGRLQNKNRQKQSESSMAINQVARFTMPYLACARVCPDPFDNSIVTVGFTKTGGWRAALWKLLDDSDDQDEENEHDETTTNSETTNTFGVEQIVSFEDDKKSEVFSGTQNIGQLLGAELALSHSPIPVSRSQREGKSTDDWELLLCSLTDNGFITTSAVAEAPSAKMKSSDTGPRFISGQKRYYFPNNEKQRWDPAAASVRKSVDHPRRISSLDESRHAYSRDATRILGSASPEKHMFESAKPLSTRDAGMSLPFDMDVGYGPISTSEPIASRGVNTSTGIVDHDVEKNAEISFQNVRMINKRIPSDHVPCPVLCGAAFSTGVGGLICFHNGRVSKMWEWYKTTDFRKKIMQSKNSNVGSSSSLYPRFKKDLDDMTKAAKDAQWGEDDDGQEEGNNESDGSMDSLFDDLSSEGMPEDLDESRHLRYQNNDVDESEDIYEFYFGSRYKPLALPSGKLEMKANEKDEGEAKVLAEVGMAIDPLSSDVLAPIVFIQYDTNCIMFNGQSVELAKYLELGDWQSKSPDAIEDFEDAAYADHERLAISSTADSLERDDTLIETTSSNTLFAATPDRPRSQSFGDAVESKVNVTLSDSNIHKLADSFPKIAPSTSSNVSKLAASYNEDMTVHDGEYIGRPHMDDSKIILRKILPTSFQNMQPGIPSSVLDDSVNQALSSNVMQQKSQGSLFVQSDHSSAKGNPQRAVDASRRIGAYTLPVRQASVRNEKIKSICLYNSNICRKMGQFEKSTTWSMIADAFENHIDEDIESFDGWGSGSSFGRELVSNVLQYYESVGDVQMMATLVCVLRHGRRSFDQGNETNIGINSLLPPDQDEKYDLCIRRYGKLVYRWGLLVKRTELHKHLSRHLLRMEGSQFLPKKDGDIQTPGISFAITCLNCNKEDAVSDGGNICSSCGDYAFRCTICDNAVRGIYTVCHLCGHGGHMNHMLKWFDENKMCPSGCGCLCTLSTTYTNKAQVATES